MKERIKEAVMKVMNEKTGVSFVEFEWELERQEIPYKGTYSVCIPTNPNVKMWSNMSEDYAEAVKELIFDDRVIKPEQAPLMVYLMDGRALSYPLAKKLGYQYQSERWLPVVFNKGNIFEL
ncbi:hypothetical protein M3225_26725 [Priestia aryabhattai]|uniref:hypothetical protein n=1 Tax=Priestia aryabhattai TaxID=412384 RepID=UPI00203B00A9|nr:hypothetical protein [Priestia aryabhattai]MCM3774014.1 hypothetical protein [Priestia aryabhattai]